VSSRNPISELEPAHIRAAPSHPNPYPYYSRLLHRGDLFRDDIDDCWVAARAVVAREVFESRLCRTRPVSEPVPAAILGGAMASLFSNLVRVTDGGRHGAMKRAVSASLDWIALSDVADVARARVIALDEQLRHATRAARVTKLSFDVPIHVLCTLLGISESHVSNVLSALAAYTGAIAAATAGLPIHADSMNMGHTAARELLALMSRVADGEASAHSLLGILLAEGDHAGCPREAVVANGVGLLVQAYAGVAALIGSTLLALDRDQVLRAQVRADSSLLGPTVQEVIRCDPSTSTTIRFVAADGQIAGCPVKAGDSIIVAIAAANRDPSLNPNPEWFDVHRVHRRHFEFGLGAHACPGIELAPTIAEIVVDHLLSTDFDFDGLTDSVMYAPSAHVRLPRFVDRIGV
jgi:cytochrome P450